MSKKGWARARPFCVSGRFRKSVVLRSRAGAIGPIHRAMGRPCLKRVARALQGERGFTSTEVAIVLVLIGLLAALAVTAFAAQRDRAEAAEAKTVARTAEIAMETY